MLNSTASLWLGLTFVVVGAINVWLILQASAQVKDAKANSRLIAAHRIGGYLFVGLYAVMAYFMVGRLGDVAGGASATAMVHMTLAMILSPLIFVKVLIARYYKNQYSILMPIGLVIFVLSFVLIGVIAGPTLVHRATRQTVSIDAADLPHTVIDVTAAAATMERRCSKCHNLDRVTGARKDARGWLATVTKMRALPDAGIPDEDARVIVSYLVSQTASGTSGPEGHLKVGRALVDQRCGRCHSLERVYRTVQSPEQWKDTVAEMVEFGADSPNAFQPGDDQAILAYLSATQIPDAVNARKVRATEASNAAANAAKAAVLDPPVSARRPYDVKMIGFIAFVCIGVVSLIARRPERGATTAKSRAATPVVVAPATAGAVAEPIAAPARSGSLILRLVSITPQTMDSKTFRFVLEDGRKLSARPGQFLTFSFLFDGKKVGRSYSICSSAARSGYVEITVKRVPTGHVSVFLNDRATVGMTVEANGPFGHFCFDESKHRNMVLLAAGSGITPLMAMLRYMDDVCLDTPVTLLYCVRTSHDVIFGEELDALRRRLGAFQYHLLISQPGPEWTGPRGHVSREFIESKVADIPTADYFLCGPPPFMEASRRILLDLGVKPERIRQESFGGGSKLRAVPPPPAATETDMAVEFARSGRTGAIRRGQSILEAAEEQGVTIPSFCRQGQCGTCKTRVLAGRVRMDAEEGLDAESKAQGFALMCVGHAETAVKVDA